MALRLADSIPKQRKPKIEDRRYEVEEEEEEEHKYTNVTVKNNTAREDFTFRQS